MSILASELIGRVAIMGVRKAVSDLESVGAASDSAGLKMAKIGAFAAVGIGVAVAAIGVAAVKMAGDFQAGLTTLVTGAGEARSAIGKVGQGILQTSVDTATSTDTLIKAMFQIESGGYRASQGLQVLKIAAEGARVGNSDLTKTTDVLLTTMHNYHLTAGQATGAMNSLVVTMKNGRMVMNDLNAALIKVLPTASALKIPLADVQGALDSMSAAGDKGAAAGTHLSMMFKMLTNPVGAAKKEMAAMGINSIDLANTMRTSLPDAFKMIQDAVAQHFVPGSVQYNNAIANILGGSKSGVAGLEILGGGMKLLRDNTTAAADALKNGGKNVQGWADVQKDLNFQLDRGHKAFDAMLIQLGTKLLPIVTPIAGRFADWFSTMAKGLGHVDFSGLASTIQGIANNLGDAFVLMGKVGTFVANSQSWKNMASDIGATSQELGNFVDSLKKLGQDQSGKNGALQTIAEGAGQVGYGFSDIADHVTTLFAVLGKGMDGTQYTMSTVQEAVFQLNGTIDKGSLSVKDATDLMKLGYVSVKDNVTGATIVLKDFVKNNGKIPGQVDALQKKYKDWLNYLVNGGTQSFDQWTASVLANERRKQAASDKSTEKFLANEHSMQNGLGQTMKVGDNLHDHLLKLNGPYHPDVKTDAITAAGSTADQTRKHLLNLNGPYKPEVNVSGILGAMSAADSVRNHLLALNGTSTWTVNTVNVGNAHASGIMNSPIGHWAMVGEQGPEMMYVPKGSSILPHQQSMNMAQGGGASNQPINLQIDGRTFARLILPHIVGNIRTATGVRV